MRHRESAAPCRRRDALLAVLLVTTLLQPAAAAAAAGAPPRIDNADGPARGDVDRHLTPLWSRGDEDDDLFFGLVPAAVPAPDGGVYVLDAQLSTVYHLDATGELVGTLGREGEGPGEFRFAGTLVPLPDGTLGVVQRFPGRIVKLRPDGTPAGVVLPGDPATGGRDMLTAAAAVDGGLVLSGAHMTRRDDGRLRRNFISLYGADGAVVVEYAGKDDDFDFAARSFREADLDFPGEDRWLALPDGRVAVALARDDYAVTVFSPDGAPALVFGRPAAAPLRDAADLDRLRARWEAGRRYQRFGTEQVFADTHPMIHDMAARGDEIWILPHAGAAAAGAFQVWDVFTLDGRWDRRERLLAPGDGLRDRLLFLDDRRVLVVSGFRDALDSLFGGGEADADADAAPVRITLYRLD